MAFGLPDLEPVAKRGKERITLQHQLFAQSLRQHDAAILIDLCHDRLAVKHLFGHFPLDRADVHRVDAQIDLVHGFDGKAFQNRAAVVAVHDHKIRPQPFAPVGVAKLDHPAE